jgi:hypothetical protein
MLLHIRPRLFSPFKNVALIDLEIHPLGMRLRGGVDLITRRPYPNKRYAVACRKKGHKAIDGLLIETAAPLDKLTTTARWAIEAAMTVTHQVHYTLLDHDFDTASDDMMFWYGRGFESGGWSNRCPASAKGVAPGPRAPMMEVVPPDSGRPATEDILDGQGRISRRLQTFAMPTIERERVLKPRFNDRVPPLETAFRAF